MHPLDTQDEDWISQRCRHIKPDGIRCGSPSVRHQPFCFYHGKTRQSAPRKPQVRTLADRKLTTLELPSPADLGERSGIQLALAHVLHALAHNELDPRRAGLLLYGLGVASRNLPRELPAKPAPYREEPVEELEALEPEITDALVAPAEEYLGPTGRKGTLETILEEMERHPELLTRTGFLPDPPDQGSQQSPPQPCFPQPGHLDDLQAAAITGRTCRSPRSRYDLSLRHSPPRIAFRADVPPFRQPASKAHHGASAPLLPLPSCDGAPGCACGTRPSDLGREATVTSRRSSH